MASTGEATRAGATGGAGGSGAVVRGLSARHPHEHAFVVSEACSVEREIFVALPALGRST